MAAILGLSLAYAFTVLPAGTSAQVVPAAVQVPSAVVASSPVAPSEMGPIPDGMGLSAHEVPPSRPSTPPATSMPLAATASPEPAAAAGPLVALVPLAIDVWNADERYFSVSGSTPDEIVASAVANVLADPSGAARSTMAYVGPIIWDHRPSYVQDPETGSCTMTAVASVVAYQATVPQWTAPSSVHPELLAWWQLVLAHIEEHESEHVRIFTGYVNELPNRVVGQPCAAWDAIIGQWTAEVTAAQSAFDASESHWALPVYTLGG
ncbi:MAG: DUF922 domain-containing protein [Candidatus Limnocylindria bacterium]